MSTQSQIEFAQWLEKEHPDFFALLATKAKRFSLLGAIYRGSFTSPNAKLGQFYLASGVANYAQYASGGALDSISSSSDMLPEITVTAQAPVTTDLNSYLTDTANTNLSVLNSTNSAVLDTGSAPTLPAGTNASNVPTVTPSAISSAASAVGNFLASPAGVNAVAATLQGAATIITAKAAGNVITAQAQRAAAGLSPANVGYAAVQDANGNYSTVPVLNTTSGQIPLNASNISALTSNNDLLYILLGLAAVYLVSQQD